MRKFTNYRGRNGGASYQNYNGNGVTPAAASATPQKRISSFNRTYVIQIVNATDADATYVVLGYNENGDGAAAGSGAGVTILVKTSTHSQLKRETQTNGLSIIAWKYRVTAAAQISEPITLRYNNSAGRTLEDTIFPDTYAEPGNFQADFLRIDDVYQTVDGFTSFTGTIQTGVTMTWILTIGSRTRLSNADEGVSVVEENMDPAPIGTSPVEVRAESRPAKSVVLQ